MKARPIYQEPYAQHLLLGRKKETVIVVKVVARRQTKKRMYARIGPIVSRNTSQGTHGGTDAKYVLLYFTRYWKK